VLAAAGAPADRPVHGNDDEAEEEEEEKEDEEEEEDDEEEGIRGPVPG